MINKCWKDYMSKEQFIRIKKLQKMCGTYAIAKHMINLGFSINTVKTTMTRSIESWH